MAKKSPSRGNSAASSDETKSISTSDSNGIRMAPPLVPTTQESTSNEQAKKVRAKKIAGAPQNTVPINLEEEIRRRAYELSAERGFSSGSETEDWLRAEREVMQRYNQTRTA